MSDTSSSKPVRRRGAHRSTRVRFAPAAIVGGVAASAAIALSMSGTLAGFVAQITNNNNNASSGYIALQETGGSTICNSNGDTPTAATQSGNTITCAINKFNGSTLLVPGSSVSASVTMKNTGNVPGTFSMTPLACSQTALSPTGGATDACSKFTLAITSGTGTPVAVKSGTLDALATGGLIPLGTLAAGASTQYNFTLTLPAQATSAIDNTYQGIRVQQNLQWNITT